MNSGCKHIMKVGMLRGQRCGIKIFSGNLCDYHYKILPKRNNICPYAGCSKKAQEENIYIDHHILICKVCQSYASKN